ncbi:hypothetical protein HYX15_04040 [Candidatus Woesearchaeota archaeon]|nr:hypothetical protein [Candidatus Woesearchaeota archaeon]
MKKKWKDWKGTKVVYKSSGGVYCLGAVGAAIYYIQQSTGFWGVVIAILKSIVWPAFLVYKLLGM